jgi:hypothetical protein
MESEAGWVVVVALAGLNLELYREFLAALVVVVLLALLPRLRRAGPF